MSVLVDSLKKQNVMLQGEVERFASGVDQLSVRLEEALNRLRQHDPAYVAEALGEPAPELMPADPDGLCPEEIED